MWRGGQIVTSDSNLVACIQLKRNNFPSETEEKIVFSMLLKQISGSP